MQSSTTIMISRRPTIFTNNKSTHVTIQFIHYGVELIIPL